MKTIKRGDEIKRVKDNASEKMISNGWGYCPKSEWKSTNGSKRKKNDNIAEPVSSDNLSDKKKKASRKEIKRQKNG